MEFKKVKVSKRCNVTIEEDRFAINDLDGTERLVDDADTYYAFNKAVYWADNLRKFVAKEFEDKYITSLGIKKGDMVAISSNMEYDSKTKEFKISANAPVSIGYYNGFKVTGFSWNDKIPKFSINIDKSWHRGCSILAAGIDAGVGFIPLVKDHDTEEFHVPENNKWLHTTIRLATAEEIKEHKEKLAEIKKALS